jgi:hypothetical protein
LKVERPRKRDRKERRNSSPTLGVNQPFNSSLFTSNKTDPSFYSKEHITHHCSVLEIDRESCGAKQFDMETSLFENPIVSPVTQSSAVTTVKDLPTIPLPLPLKPSLREREPQNAKKNGRHSVKPPSSKKKRKVLRNTESETRASCAISAGKDSGCSDVSFATNLNSNDIKHAVTTSSDTFLSGGGGSSWKPLKKRYGGSVTGSALGTFPKATDREAVGQSHWNMPELSELESSDITATQTTNPLELYRRQPIELEISHIIGSTKVGSLDKLSSDDLKVSKSAAVTVNEMLVRMISHDISQSAFDVSLSTKKKLRWSGRKESVESKSTREAAAGRHSFVTENNSGEIAGIMTLDNRSVAQKKLGYQSARSTAPFSTGINSKTLRVKINSAPNRHVKTKSNSSSDSTHSSNYTLFNGPGSQASSTTTRSLYKNRHEDIDMIPHSKQAPKDPKFKGQKKINGNVSTVASVKKADSGTKNVRRDNTHTRISASGTGSQTGCEAKSSTPINRKENKELSSPKLLLSDLTQWPVLGSSKPPVLPKPIISQPKIASTVRLLSNRLPQSALLRRDSITSVLSASSPIARQLT